MPHSHQSLNTFKSCLIKQGLKLFPENRQGEWAPWINIIIIIIIKVVC